jgi:hypothetical protein
MPKSSFVLPVYHNILESLAKTNLGKIIENISVRIFIANLSLTIP